ncbi:MAG TPA: response regulator transcription factor [Fimbriimonadaceae bacterium]|nr:response regulator transcription factor [Fimbriimonadaceae bacterium]
MSKIRVMLAEDDSLLRNTLGELLQLDPEMALVSTVSNGEQAVAEAHILKPDVILMDIEMPRLTGIEATRRIREKLPEIQVVILTKFGDDEKVFAAIKAGALGYLLKDAGLEEIRKAVIAAKNGEGVLSPILVSKVLGEFNRLTQVAAKNRELFAELSRREVEVLELLASGMKNSAIADKLCLSEKTVKTHVGSILRKLHVNDRAEAALVAKEHGIRSS